mgnify:CR=1 FL=1
MIIKKAAILGAIASSALVLSACNLYKTSSTGSQTGITQTQEQQTQAQPTEIAAIVTFSDSGVSPATVTIKSGQGLTWTNNSKNNIQVASANHPTHTINPELTKGEFVIELSPGENSSVKLEKVGNFGYHDHLDLTVFGKVVVE